MTVEFLRPGSSSLRCVGSSEYVVDLEDNLKSKISPIFHFDYMQNSDILDIMDYITYVIKTISLFCLIM